MIQVLSIRLANLISEIVFQLLKAILFLQAITKEINMPLSEQVI